MRALESSAQEHAVLLVERIKINRDDVAFSELYSLHRTLVYSIALRMMGTPYDAEEVTQEVFLKVFQKIDSFQGKSRFSTWLTRITYNTALELLRKKKKKSSLFMMTSLDNALSYLEEDTGPLMDNLVAQGPGPEAGLEHAELRMLLSQKVRSLPPNQMLVVLLRFFCDEETKKVAEIMGCTAGTVKSNQHKAIQKLRAHEEFRSMRPLAVACH